MLVSLTTRARYSAEAPEVEQLFCLVHLQPSRCCANLIVPLISEAVCDLLVSPPALVGRGATAPEQTTNSPRGRFVVPVSNELKSEAVLDLLPRMGRWLPYSETDEFARVMTMSLVTSVIGEFEGVASV